MGLRRVSKVGEYIRKSDGSNTFWNISTQRPQNDKKKRYKIQINNTLEEGQFYFKLGF